MFSLDLEYHVFESVTFYKVNIIVILIDTSQQRHQKSGCCFNAFIFVCRFLFWSFVEAS